MGGSADEWLDEFPDTPPEDTDNGGVQAVSGLTRRALDLMRTDFAESTWRAFCRQTIDERPAAEVAEELGLSVAAVYKAKSRVLAHLRRELHGLE